MFVLQCFTQVAVLLWGLLADKYKAGIPRYKRHVAAVVLSILSFFA